MLRVRTINRSLHTTVLQSGVLMTYKIQYDVHENDLWCMNMERSAAM